MLSDTGPVQEDAEIIAKLKAAGMIGEYWLSYQFYAVECFLKAFPLVSAFKFWAKRIKLNWLELQQVSFITSCHSEKDHATDIQVLSLGSFP